MIGTGIFTSLGFQLAGIPSAFGIVLIWVLGGIIALCGALSYAELGAAFPRSGGEYHLLGKTWHPLAGFVAGWLSITVGFAAPVALAAAAFGSYLANSAFGGTPTARVICSGGVLAGVTVMHLINVRVSARFQVASTLLKVGLLGALVIAGLRATTQPVAWLPQPTDVDLLWRPEFAIALFFVSYSYSGWNAAVYIAGEMRNPRRDLPWALIAGTAFVTVIYVLVNISFLKAAPVGELAGRPDVALVAARHIFGESGGAVMGVFIAAGLVSTLSAMTWAGPLVAQTMGEDWPVLRPLARTSRTGIPHVATLVQSAVALVLLHAGGFEEVLTYTQFTLSLSAFLTVAGVFHLRWRRPDIERPFKAWGYPFTPALFLLFTGYTLVRFATDPAQWMKSLLGLATVSLGAVLYFVRPRRNA